MAVVGAKAGWPVIGVSSADGKRLGDDSLNIRRAQNIRSIPIPSVTLDIPLSTR